jgi:aspartate carbamoyltransferase catalytic subunit
MTMATSSRPTTSVTSESKIRVLASLVDKLTCDPSTWDGASLLSVKQPTPSGVSLLFHVAEQMKDLVIKKGGDNRLANKVLATCFYEASTRTASSFQVAMQRLGGTVIHVDGQGNSSAKKEESLHDVTVLRHPVTGSVACGTRCRECHQANRQCRGWYW